MNIIIKNCIFSGFVGFPLGLAIGEATRGKYESSIITLAVAIFILLIFILVSQKEIK
jgi:hypothetical protein